MRDVSVLCGVLAIWAAGGQVQSAAGAGHDAERPNIVFMMSDDQAWNGLSVPMHPELLWSRSRVVETPHLEQLAAEGMRFSAAYAPASVCSPTRISLQTGKSPAAMHWTKAAPAVRGQKLLEPQNIRQLPASELTIGEILQRAGYATAHYGKWHIGGGGPAANGYDDGDGDIGNEYAYEFVDPNPADIFGMAERAAAFMERSRESGKPFFIQLSWHALHAPENALQETLRKYSEKLGAAPEERRVTRAAIAENLDTGVGRVLAAIDRLGLRETTYVIYMSDNGSGGDGGGQRGPGAGGGAGLAAGRPGLAGGKGSVWEGGIRSPFIIRGPGIEAGSWCHQRIVGYDLYPTFCEWAGLKDTQLPAGLEGGSIVSLLEDGQGAVQRVREELVFHFPHYQSSDGPHSAIILGDLKLLKFYETGRVALFDLAEDLTEQRDMTATRPRDAAQLELLLHGYLLAVNAQMPEVNPGYDPNNVPALRIGEGGRGPGAAPGRPGMRRRPGLPGSGRQLFDE